jgi:trk system potassium uptake protein TrkH
MSDWKPVLFVLGYLLIALAAAMAVPTVADAASGDDDWSNFAAAAAATLAAGGILLAANWSPEIRLTVRQAFLLTTLSWAVLSGFAALPFLFSTVGLSYADAFFEAISALTTTGSTIFTNLDRQPPGILLWRALLQWLGGIGIIAMAVVMLPFLNVGGMQLFRMESSDRSEKILPRPREIATSLMAVYLLMTALCLAAYWALGMTPFDALCHALTTVATGGYSNYDSSFAHFADRPALQWAAIVFMLAGALPFVFFVGLLRGRIADLTRSQQVRGFLVYVLVVALVFSFWLWATQGHSPGVALRLGVFTIVSMATTTGFVVADHTSWGGFAEILILIVALIGACAGSTGGGLKFYRVHVLFDMMRARVRQLLFPRAMLSSSYDGRPVSLEVRASIALFVFAYVGAIGVIALALAALGLDFLTALTSAVTAVGNLGIGFGPVIGASGIYASLSDAAKWVLSAGMLLGRLEIFTVLVILSASFWRR